MKVLLIALYRHLGSDASPILLGSAMDLSSFSFFTRNTIGEHVRFASRLVVQRTTSGSRQTVDADEQNPFVVHSYCRHDNLSGAIVSDKEYPQRVAFTLLNKIMRDYEASNRGEWKSITKDITTEDDQMKKDLVAYQNPAEADKLTKIQRELDDIKEIMHKNIDDVLQRGETLDSLMTRSADLSDASVMFYKQAKKTNQCCKYY